MANTGQTGPKRTRKERETDLSLTIKLWSQGYTLREIAEKISANRKYRITFRSIHNDIKAEIKRWREERLDIIEDQITVELIRINNIEKEAWEAWEKSKAEYQRSVTERRSGTSETMRAQMVREEQCGDPRYLQIIQWCIDKRCKLFGLDAPKKIEATGPVRIEVVYEDSVNEPAADQT